MRTMTITPAHLLTLTTEYSDLGPVFVMNIYSLLKFNHVLGTVVRPSVAGQGRQRGPE